MAARRGTGSRSLRVVEDPAMEAYKLRLTGLSNAEIAKRKLGYSSGAEVARAIKVRIEHEARQVAQEERETILQMELDRLDVLQQAYWELAVGGSLDDAKYVLSVIKMRIELNQLHMPDARQIGQTVLIVKGDTEGEYVASLGGQVSENKS